MQDKDKQESKIQLKWDTCYNVIKRPSPLTKALIKGAFVTINHDFSS